MSRYIFTSESVSEGHPDKVCDYIADSILDAHLAADPCSRVACEVLCKSGQVVLAGEITSSASVDYERIAREAIREIGYIDPQEPFNAGGVQITQFISRQSPDLVIRVLGFNPDINVGQLGVVDRGNDRGRHVLQSFETVKPGGRLGRDALDAPLTVATTV